MIISSKSQPLIEIPPEIAEEIIEGVTNVVNATGRNIEIDEPWGFELSITDKQELREMYEIATDVSYDDLQLEALLELRAVVAKLKPFLSSVISDLPYKLGETLGFGTRRARESNTSNTARPHCDTMHQLLATFNDVAPTVCYDHDFYFKDRQRKVGFKEAAYISKNLLQNGSNGNKNLYWWRKFRSALLTEGFPNSSELIDITRNAIDDDPSIVRRMPNRFIHLVDTETVHNEGSNNYYFEDPDKLRIVMAVQIDAVMEKTFEEEIAEIKAQLAQHFDLEWINSL